MAARGDGIDIYLFFGGRGRRIQGDNHESTFKESCIRGELAGRHQTQSGAGAGHIKLNICLLNILRKHKTHFVNIPHPLWTQRKMIWIRQ
jgi:hypothetical protein